MGANNSKTKITAQDKAILDMKIQRDKLRQFQRRVQTVLDREDALARDLLRKGDKKRALLALRRRKYQEQTIAKTDDQLLNLQRLVETIEFSLVQRDVFFGLEQGNRVLTELNREMRIEDVERLADETAEGVAYQNEISNILQANMSVEDEEAALAELEELEKQEADRLGLGLPRAPETRIPASEYQGVRNAGDKETDERQQQAEEHEEETDEESQRARNEPMLA
ncbi:Vacuolar protein sorting-associated protein 20 [Coemansia sp. RSA 1200]|nr:Vacuolar protein sorting-associated protein 20 [Coemansia sp. RSA 1200]